MERKETVEKKELKTLFPEIEPYNTGMLKVDDIHEIYYEECGNPNGKPVIYVHGGPGCGCSEKSRRFVDPSFYRIICFDQRGCGRSKPFLELKNNTTADLAADMEKIREHLGIDKWMVFGGSWGTTLALYYSENYPERVASILLRGVFLGRKEDIDWLYQGGAGMFFPEAYESFTDLVEGGADNISTYYSNLKSSDKAVQRKYGKAFSNFELSCVALHPWDLPEEIADTDISMAIMECHYFENNCFFEENYILDNAHKIADIPIYIVHGRYDVDCRPVGAYLLHKKLNHSELHYPICGHSSSEPEIIDALVGAQEKYKQYF